LFETDVSVIVLLLSGIICWFCSSARSRYNNRVNRDGHGVGDGQNVGRNQVPNIPYNRLRDEEAAADQLAANGFLNVREEGVPPNPDQA
jgi:hypothetical protein